MEYYVVLDRKTWSDTPCDYRLFTSREDAETWIDARKDEAKVYGHKYEVKEVRLVFI